MPATPVDPFELARFVAAQDGVIEGALEELAAGRKRGHWMWFVFPQLRGLGRSATAWRYGIQGMAEARAYLAHPVLGARLRACCAAAMTAPGRSAHAIFGSPDDMKLRSCLTLFAAAARAGSDPAAAAPFEAALAHFHGGERDAATLALLRSEGHAPA